jgi:hypothetical protein
VQSCQLRDSLWDSASLSFPGVTPVQVAPERNCSHGKHHQRAHVLERHDAEATRAQGPGVHAPSKEQKIVVGSSDDPSILSLLNARVRSLRPRLVVHSEPP